MYEVSISKFWYFPIEIFVFNNRFIEHVVEQSEVY